MPEEVTARNLTNSSIGLHHPGLEVESAFDLAKLALTPLLVGAQLSRRATQSNSDGESAVGSASPVGKQPGLLDESLGSDG
jgi:hypothetical protein